MTLSRHLSLSSSPSPYCCCDLFSSVLNLRATAGPETGERLPLCVCVCVCVCVYRERDIEQNISTGGREMWRVYERESAREREGERERGRDEGTERAREGGRAI